MREWLFLNLRCTFWGFVLGSVLQKKKNGKLSQLSLWCLSVCLSICLSHSGEKERERGQGGAEEGEKGRRWKTGGEGGTVGVDSHN